LPVSASEIVSRAYDVVRTIEDIEREFRRLAREAEDSSLAISLTSLRTLLVGLARACDSVVVNGRFPSTGAAAPTEESIGQGFAAGNAADNVAKDWVERIPQAHAVIAEPGSHADVAALLRLVIEWFRLREPSSPAPCLLESALGMVGADFSALVHMLCPVSGPKILEQLRIADRSGVGAGAGSPGRGGG
jgi:predicted component of type VI protein secretion system